MSTGDVLHVMHSMLLPRGASRPPRHALHTSLSPVRISCAHPVCASRVCSEYNSVDRLAIITWRRVEAQASLVATSRRASVGQRFADESAAGCAFAKTEGA